MINPLKALIEFFANPIADLTGSYRERKRIAAQSASVIAQAEINVKLATLEAKEKRLLTEHSADKDYDLQVLENRNKTPMDEILIGTWLILFVAHFSPFSQPYMQNGWLAMGYSQVPWWFEFGMVGILVSTLGLMRLFKLLIGRWKNGRININ